MAQTAKYCPMCAGKLCSADKSPQDKAFFKASLFAVAGRPIGEPAQTEQGVCEKCGASGMVMFYEIVN